MTYDPQSKQTDASVAKNISFFQGNLQAYNTNVQELDTYAAIRASINQSLPGISRLLDIGNGGVFDYDIGLVHSIVALDLFLDDLPASYVCPTNVTLKTGSALSVPESDESFEGVLVVMLIHHLTGKTVGESLDNVRCAVREAFRVLRPGGKLVIIESCVPQWFYLFERGVFRPASFLINALLQHPATLQYPVSLLAQIIQEHSSKVEVVPIPKGRWVLQYGFKFPAALTPVTPYKLVAYKPDSVTPHRKIGPGA